MYKMWRLNIHSTRARKHLHLYMYIVRVMKPVSIYKSVGAGPCMQ